MYRVGIDIGGTITDFVAIDPGGQYLLGKVPLDCSGFDPSSPSRFRKRLLQHGKERYASDRLVQVGRAAGLTRTRWLF